MKNILLTGLIVFLIVSVTAQNTDSKKNSRIEIGFVISPNYNYRLVGIEARYKDIPPTIVKKEIPDIRITTGVSLLYQVFNRFYFETGILYSDKGLKTSEIRVIDNNPDNGNIIVEKILTYNLKYNYLDIPLNINYVILHGDLKWFFSLGASANFFLYDKTIITDKDNGKTSEYNTDNDFKKLNFSLLIGTGVDYDINENWKVRVLPVYRRSITPSQESKYYSLYPYSFAIDFGIYYKL